MSIEGQCLERKISKSNYASFTTIPHPFAKGCILSAEFFIITLTIWIFIASAGLVAAICFNLPPDSLAYFKEKFRSWTKKSTKGNKEAYFPGTSTLMTESTQINRT